jgi:signal transduction histidine kinase
LRRWNAPGFSRQLIQIAPSPCYINDADYVGGFDRADIEGLLDLGAEGYVMGDGMRLQQVFWNLLTNAVKFTPKRGQVNVSLRRVGSDVEIKVSDTGRGISAEFLPHVFDRFLQENKTETGTYSGLGLGLAIARHIVELHGGNVTAESLGENKGATFTVILPALTEAVV